jgi:peptide/nickel transport system permease protein
MFPGEVGLTIGIVVIFAYLLGMVVLLLDVAYAIVDPRIRLGSQQQRLLPTRFKPRIQKKPALIAVAMLGVGILAGMLIGWVIWPVQYTDAAPSDLHPAFQATYSRMLIDSFLVSPDSGLARARFDALGENAASVIEALAANAAEDPELREQLNAFAAGYQSGTGNPDLVIPSTRSSLIKRVLNLPIVTVVLKYALYGSGAALLIAGLTVGFIRFRKSRHARLSAQTPSRLAETLREIMRYRSAVAGLIILAVMISGSIFGVIRYPYQEIGSYWEINALKNYAYVPRTAYPTWVNLFRKNDFPETIIINSAENSEVKSVNYLDNGNPDYTFTLEFDYPYGDFPSEATLYFEVQHDNKKPFATLEWTTPDGRKYDFKNAAISNLERYNLEENLDRRQIADHLITYRQNENDAQGTPLFYGLFQDPESPELKAIPGTYTLEVKVLSFEPDTDVDIELVLLGQVYGAAGTDFYRRDLTVPLLWGMPFALVIGLFGALLTTVISMLFAAFGVWFGGWADNLVQRVTEANMILPVVAIAVLFYAFYGASLWTILTIIVILNAFGSPTKTFRAAFLQIKDASYIEAAQAYGAPNRRIILRYMIPRILPVLIPQLVTLIPGFIFLEATLGMFNVKSNLPTWGKVIYEALAHGAAWGSKFWVLEPIALLLLTGFAFSMMGFALDRVLNPRLQQGD